MMKKTLIAAAAIGSIAIASPALAWGSWGGSSGSWGWSSSGGHTSHYCGCGDSTGDGMCGTSTGGTPPSTTTSTGGNEVPEPGMLGIAGAGLIGLGLIRRRKAMKKS